MNDQDDRKLDANFVFLFAAVALGAALALPHVAPSLLGHSIKSGAGVFGVIFAAGGVAATLLARTSTGRAVGAFLLVGLAHTVYWYVKIHSASSESGGAANALGTAVAIKLALSFGGASIVGGVGGALFGQKVRQNIKKTAAALASRR
jgi:uncharacterized PurR-regulated membrane protein YhhQ (DUF165 family)